MDELKIDDPLLDIAREMEERALNDDFFKQARLYPNVDFYSGILLRAINIPVNMFTLMFAIGRVAGWIAQWREEIHESRSQHSKAAPGLYRQKFKGSQYLGI